MNTKSNVVVVRVGKDYAQAFLDITDPSRFVFQPGTVFYPDNMIQYVVDASDQQILVYKLAIPNIKIKVARDAEKLTKYYRDAGNYLRLAHTPAA
jgi:hypothetical protein